MPPSALILGKTAWKPLVKALSDREAKIRASLEQAERAHEEAREGQPQGLAKALSQPSTRPLGDIIHVRHGQAGSRACHHRHLPQEHFEQWEPLILITGDQNLFTTRYREATKDHVIAFLTTDPNNPNSIVSSLAAARENARSVREVLDIMLAHTPVQIDEESDPAKFRPSDTPISYADPSKFKRQTGWEPQISFEQTCVDILNDWRGRLS